jgi:hypothetical protein
MYTFKSLTINSTLITIIQNVHICRINFVALQIITPFKKSIHGNVIGEYIYINYKTPGFGIYGNFQNNIFICVHIINNWLLLRKQVFFFSMLSFQTKQFKSNCILKYSCWYLKTYTYGYNAPKFIIMVNKEPLSIYIIHVL